MEKLAEFKKIIRTEVPLAMHTWMQLGGPAEYFAEPRSELELLQLLQACLKEQISIRVLGMGSNVLVSDQGVPGMVIRLSAPVFCEIETSSPYVVAGAGAKFGRVITNAVHDGLAGLESFIGIPGSVGGAIMQNIATNDGSIGQWIDSIRIVTFAGEMKTLSRQDIVFGYRNCGLDNAIILSVKFKLTPENEKEVSRRLQKIWIVRKKNQPIGNQGIGYLFGNPRGQRASELIDEVGLKGTKIGGASVSERNANFVLIDSECSCDDVKRLIRLIQTQVREQREIDLDLEIQLW
ncbi:MAG: UDP-N-acetylmuramate dehydrogenase [Planctomycetia bacterium]|nr:UDP-N-acetylmuramate dehydrogenase [Planctomycetia bacterium]